MKDTCKVWPWFVLQFLALNMLILAEVCSADVSNIYSLFFCFGGAGTEESKAKRGGALIRNERRGFPSRRGGEGRTGAGCLRGEGG